MADNCQVQTPKKYVIDMLDYIGYDNRLYGKRVLENSCGEGNGTPTTPASYRNSVDGINGFKIRKEWFHGKNIV